MTARPRASAAPTVLSRCGGGGDEQIRARECRRAQDRAHLGTEPAAGDEHQPLGDLGELVGELHRDSAAERVPDERRALVSERDQQIAQSSRERPDRVVAGTGRRRAMPGQIGRDNGVVPRQRLDHRLPVFEVAGHPVDQQQHRAAARLRVGQRPAVERDRPGFHRAHRDAPAVIRASASASSMHESRTRSGAISKVSATPGAASRTPTPTRARCIEPSTCV